MMNEFQWPHYVKPNASLSEGSRESLIGRIHEFFETRFGTHVAIMPSARAAVAQLIRYKAMGRAQTVYAPKWSSTCVWDAVVPTCNPTTAMSKEVDLALVVHKWGYITHCERKTLIVEDSVDSLIESPSGLFPNNGWVEIFSLPKLIGSLSGGIVASRDQSAIRWLRDLYSSAPELAHKQWQRRNVESPPDKNSDWHTSEHLNSGLADEVVRDIASHLELWGRNSDLIRNRRQTVVEKVGPGLLRDEDKSRRQPVMLFPTSRYRIETGFEAKIPVRHFDTARSVENPVYEKCFVMPIHMGVADPDFQAMVKAVRPL